jgi:hypothetical protein
MKVRRRLALSARTYEMQGSEWREVEPQALKPPAGSFLRGLGALVATACTVAIIFAIGIVGTAVALVLRPAGLLAVWFACFKRRSS